MHDAGGGRRIFRPVRVKVMIQRPIDADDTWSSDPCARAGAVPLCNHCLYSESLAVDEDGFTSAIVRQL